MIRTQEREVFCCRKIWRRMSPEGRRGVRFVKIHKGRRTQGTFTIKSFGTPLVITKTAGRGNRVCAENWKRCALRVSAKVKREAKTRNAARLSETFCILVRAPKALLRLATPQTLYGKLQRKQVKMKKVYEADSVRGLFLLCRVSLRVRTTAPLFAIIYP